MLRMSKIVCSAALCVALGTVATAASNTNKGSTPNGKPFVHLSGAVASLQDQVNALVERVETVEERATVLEGAVVELGEKNIVLEEMIGQNGIDNAAADAELQAQIYNNKRLISAMQSEIDLIKENLEISQNIVDGVCPDGEVVIGISENSLSCAPANIEKGQLYTYKTVSQRRLPPHSYYPGVGSGFNQCLWNGETRQYDKVTGGGHSSSVGASLIASRPASNGWQTIFENPQPYEVILITYAVCAGIK